MELPKGNPTLQHPAVLDESFKLFRHKHTWYVSTIFRHREIFVTFIAVNVNSDIKMMIHKKMKVQFFATVLFANRAHKESKAADSCESYPKTENSPRNYVKSLL